MAESTVSPNPLQKHFRKVSLHLKLPSRGKWWPEGSISYPESGDIAILPMTAQDEILLKTPDAVLKGEGIVKVIESCCPSIRHAWKMPSVDVDAILIAIRIASYGNNMTMDVACPACGTKHDHSVDLGKIVHSMPPVDYSILESHDLKIQLRPQEFFNSNAENLLTQEEQRMMQLIADPSIEGEQRDYLFKQALKKLVDINIKFATDSTVYIELDSGEKVSDREHIKEFYENADRSVLADIKDHLGQAKELADIKPLDVTCPNCGHEFKTNLTF